MFVGVPAHCRGILEAALSGAQMGLRPHTLRQYQRQFKLFLAFVISRRFIQLDSVPVILVFLEF